MSSFLISVSQYSSISDCTDFSSRFYLGCVGVLTNSYFKLSINKAKLLIPSSHPHPSAASSLLKIASTPSRRCYPHLTLRPLPIPCSLSEYNISSTWSFLYVHITSFLPRPCILATSLSFALVWSTLPFLPPSGCRCGDGKMGWETSGRRHAFGSSQTRSGRRPS